MLMFSGLAPFLVKLFLLSFTLGKMADLLLCFLLLFLGSWVLPYFHSFLSTLFFLSSLTKYHQYRDKFLLHFFPVIILYYAEYKSFSYLSILLFFLAFFWELMRPFFLFVLGELSLENCFHYNTIVFGPVGHFFHHGYRLQNTNIIAWCIALFLISPTCHLLWISAYKYAYKWITFFLLLLKKLLKWYFLILLLNSTTIQRLSQSLSQSLSQRI